MAEIGDLSSINYFLLKKNFRKIFCKNIYPSKLELDPFWRGEVSLILQRGCGRPGLEPLAQPRFQRVLDAKVSLHLIRIFRANNSETCFRIMSSLTPSMFQSCKLQVREDLSAYRRQDDHLPQVWSGHGHWSWKRKGMGTQVKEL